MLHYACRGGNLDVVKLLLERGVASVSEQNSDKNLPIGLLFETANDEVDRESIEYIDTVYRMLSAYPLAVSEM